MVKVSWLDIIALMIGYTVLVVAAGILIGALYLTWRDRRNISWEKTKQDLRERAAALLGR